MNTILARIKAATPQSPIAVFATKNGPCAQFADTVQTQNRIAAKDPTLLGVFDSTTPELTVRRALSRKTAK